MKDREICPCRVRDRDVSVLIGAVHGHARSGQAIQQDLVGVPVIVVRTDRDQCHPGPGSGEEGRYVGRAAVVGDLQDVGAEVVSPTEQITLRLGLHITGRQNRHIADGDPGHDRGIVRIRSGADVARHRTQHLDRGRSHRTCLPRAQGQDVYVGSCGDPKDTCVSLNGRGIGTRRDRPDRPPPEHSVNPVNVIGVQVGEHEQGNLLHPESAQTAVHQYRVRAGIHDYGTARSQ